MKILRMVLQTLIALPLATGFTGCFEDPTPRPIISESESGDGDPTDNGDGDGGSANEGNEDPGDGDGEPGNSDLPGDSGGNEAFCGNGIVEADEECDDGNPLNNDACTAACINAVCGDGLLYEGQEYCDDGNTKDWDGCSCELEYKLAFITSLPYIPGVDFSSLEEADAKCQAAARQAGLTGVYLTLLADGQTAPSDRFPDYTDETEILRRDGLRVNYWGMLKLNQVTSTISLDEDGNAAPLNIFAWTGTYGLLSKSQVPHLDACNNWQPNSPEDLGNCGDPNDPQQSIWFGFGCACNQPNHLYCLQS